MIIGLTITLLFVAAFLSDLALVIAVGRLERRVKRLEYRGQ